MNTQTSFNFDDIEQMASVVESWMFEADANTQREFVECPRDDLVKYHSSLGRNIRNHFSLWSRTWQPEFKKVGSIEVDASPNHPDEISMRIIERVWERNQKDQ